MTEFVNPRANHKPLGAYSHSVKVPHDVEWLVISGQVGINVKGQLQAGPRKQAEQVFRNIRAVLATAGVGLGDIVKTTVYLDTMDDFKAMNAVYAEAFGDHRPARSTVAVDALPVGALVEIEVIAEVG